MALYKTSFSTVSLGTSGNVNSLNSDNKEINMAKPKEKTEIPNTSNDFLLAEYQRLADFQKSASDSYQRRFDIYLAVFSAAVLGFLSLSGLSSSADRETVLYIILIALIIVGLIIFTSMASINTWQIHLERAMRMIQARYVQGDPSLSSLLYFSTQRTGIGGTGYGQLLVRGIISGGPKTILVIGNSIAISSLLIKFLTTTSLKLFPNTLAVIGIATFIFSGLLHVLFAKVMYKIGGI